MKIFTIPGLEIEFIQHRYSQAVSSDTFALYSNARKVLSSYTYLSEQKKAPLKVMDLGTGNGILLLMLAKEFMDVYYTGIEILKELVDIAKLNLERLSTYLKKKVNYQIINANYNELQGNIPKDSSFDLIISNPPYYPIGDGKVSSVYEKAVSRFELTATMSELLKCIKTYLSVTGKAFVIYPNFRMKDMEKLCNELALICFYKKEASDLDIQCAKNRIIFEISHA